MKLLILLLITILANCNLEIKRNIISKFINGPTKDLFKTYHLVYEKSYDLYSEEGIRRYQNFKANLKIIKETNSKNLSYKLGINKFADMTQEEFKNTYLMDPNLKRNIIEKTINNITDENKFDNFQDENEEKIMAFTPVDHSKWFNPVRDQGQCGSCWAFASLGALEASVSKKLGKLYPYLSTQQLVDCNTSNMACYGGASLPAFQYLKNAGIVLESNYPYLGKQGNCKSLTNPENLIESINYCSNYGNKKCNTNMVYDFLTKQPVVSAIDGIPLQLYESGIFTENCNEDNHAVVLVGYGVERVFEYWNVRNSWGEDWGEKGYFRVSRNDKNKNSCFLTNEAILAVPK